MFAQMVQVNWLAILVCGIASMVVGFVWYGPLFGKRWAALTGWTEQKIRSLPQNNMPVTYGLAFVLLILAAFVLANVLKLAQATTIADGLLAGFATWLGFVATTMGVNELFERTPLSLLAINAGYQLVNFLVFSLILVLWQ